MLRRLRLLRFKSFQDAELELGQLTVVVGTNASGKSNLRDALRFLHGVGRGYTLAEILGEKWGEGGVQWRGIRGGVREVSYDGADSFAIEVDTEILLNSARYNVTYRIAVDVMNRQKGPRIREEWLRVEGLPGDQHVFRFSRADPPAFTDDLHIGVRERQRVGATHYEEFACVDTQPVLSQVEEHREVGEDHREFARATVQALGSMRFLDLDPNAMRFPSVPGQRVLTDRGENLSSVLHSISQDAHLAQTMVSWLQEVTPMDVSSLDFETDAAGRVLVTLVEEDGRRTTAYSASDGTLRFLAMLAALLGPESARFYFFEELENGIHPTRLALLLDLMERQTTRGATQVVATTHSPDLLGMLRNGALEHAAETYRLENSRSCGIRRIVEIPHAREVIEAQGLSRLHASGWLEDALAFTAERPAP